MDKVINKIQTCGENQGYIIEKIKILEKEERPNFYIFYVTGSVDGMPFGQRCALHKRNQNVLWEMHDSALWDDMIGD